MARRTCSLPTRPTLLRERELFSLGYTRIAGVDEAGRGPLAGPVVAAAVVLSQDFDSPHFAHLNDSKQLAPALRNVLFDEITGALEFGVGIVDAGTIDSINIRQASWQAMQQAVADLQRRSHERSARAANHGVPVELSHGGLPPVDIAAVSPPPIDYVLIDGLPYGAGPWPYAAIIKGDALSLSIAAASVVAKVTRDRIMEEYDTAFPPYGFARHKGYSSAQHLRALAEHGPCAIHRRTYAPVRRVDERGCQYSLPCP